MLTSVVPEALIYHTANRLIEQHGAKAMAEANRLLSRALEGESKRAPWLCCGSGWRLLP